MGPLLSTLVQESKPIYRGGSYKTTETIPSSSGTFHPAWFLCLRFTFVTFLDMLASSGCSFPKMQPPNPCTPSQTRSLPHVSTAKYQFLGRSFTCCVGLELPHLASGVRALSEAHATPVWRHWSPTFLLFSTGDLEEESSQPIPGVSVMPWLPY